jgi:hypothetical protein
MEKQIQLFQVADLIFSYSENEELSLTQKEINEIEARFKNIVKSFEKFENTDFAGGIKHKEMPLPYNSAIHIRRERKRLVLHFTCNE